MWIVSRLKSALVQTLYKKGRKKLALRSTKEAPPQAGIRLIFRFSVQCSPIPQPKTPSGKTSEQKQIVVLSVRALVRNSYPLGSLTVKSKNEEQEKRETGREESKTNIKFRFVVVTILLF